MARGAQPVIRAAPPAAALAVAALVLGPLAALAAAARGPWALAPGDLAAIRFTLLQAAVSAALSCALAIPLARALARRIFRGRRLLVTLLGAPFLLPALVAVAGLLAVFGRSGLFSHAFAALGLPFPEIYGPGGVVLAHVFLNLPLVTRLLLRGWAEIPAERFRLAASLGLPAGSVNRLLEAPMLRERLPGAFAAVFLICLTSFAVALTLGGGPRATTVELAIFQAIRFEGDLGRAALLGLVQVALTLPAALAAQAVAAAAGFGAGLDRPPPPRPEAARPLLRLQDAAVIALGAVFLILPVAAVAAAGAPALAGLSAAVWTAAARSAAVAGAAGLVAMALALAWAAGPRRGGVLRVAGDLPLAASPLVMGTGLFLLVLPHADPATLALPAAALVAALLALPFGLRAVLPARDRAEADFGRLADSLGLAGAARLRLVVLPRIRRGLGLTAGLAAAFAAGDLGVVALFADPGRATLALELQRLMGAYRMQAAAGAALVLLALALGSFALFDRWGRRADP
jgi:thiamine transport system permease protein